MAVGWHLAAGPGLRLLGGWWGWLAGVLSAGGETVEIKAAVGARGCGSCQGCAASAMAVLWAGSRGSWCRAPVWFYVCQVGASLPPNCQLRELSGIHLHTRAGLEAALSIPPVVGAEQHPPQVSRASGSRVVGPCVQASRRGARSTPAPARGRSQRCPDDSLPVFLGGGQAQ